MKTEVTESLIISLIKDDLINSKLVNALTNAGLNAAHYHLHLGDTIFKLIGFDEDHYSDQAFEHYHELKKKAGSINIAGAPDALDSLAVEIFYSLKKKVPPSTAI